MMKYSDYESQANTVKIEDITSDEGNAAILRRLRQNDPSFTELWFRNAADDDQDYVPQNPYDAGWLGYFVGKSKILKKIFLNSESDDEDIFTREMIESFCRGVCYNSSINEISFDSFDSLGGDIFQLLDPFFNNNPNLDKFYVHDCNFGAGNGHYLSLALAGCKCLKDVELFNSDIGDEQFADIVVALSMHRKLESIRLGAITVGRNGCMALATLLKWSATELTHLYLSDNGIDDEGVDALVGALLHHNKLQKLDINSNASITSRGLRTISTLLTSPISNLEILGLSNMNGFGDEEAVVFARALANDSKLEVLYLSDCSITATGWAAFTKLLCDTSSINKTHSSNHTLKEICGEGRPQALRDLLNLNRDQDKHNVAIKKIIQHHDHFDMKPLFEWEFKTFPSVISIFNKAATCVREEDTVNAKCRKLTAIYQFVRGMPVLYVEAHTHKELEDIQAKKMKLKQKQMKLKREQMMLLLEMEEVEASESRVKRRLC